MRITRIRLKNFCGVVEAEAGFATKGVTIVHGQNEAGKSTLMLGINVLFDHRDDSRKEEVRLTKPVHKDVGSEVEADVEIGVCRFTYFKRFHKDRETRLTLYAPKAENLTGREAHDRVQQILAENLDTNLWRALRIVQGQNLIMPELHNQPALAQALDHVAGQVKAGEREEGLYEAVRSEYLQYFTDRGREKEDPIGKARSEADTAKESEQELQRQLKELENDITRAENLEKLTRNLNNKLKDLDTAETKAQEVWDRVSRLSDNVERCRNTYQLAAQTLASAKSAMQRRNQCIDELERAVKTKNEAEEKEAEAARVLGKIKNSLESAKNEFEKTKITFGQREDEQALHRSDYSFRIQELELVRLKERYEYVTKAEAAARVANNVIATTAMTEQLRTLIRDSEINLETARRVLNTASPQMHIKALQRVAVAINGVPETLESGYEYSTSVTEPITAQIGTSVNIRVDPGASAETLKQNLLEAEQALAKICRNAGVLTPQEAECAWQELQDARRTVENRDRILKEHLGNLGRAELEALIQSTEARVSAYLGNRQSNLPLPADVEDAKNVLDISEKSAEEARHVYRATEAIFEQVNEQHTQALTAHAVKAAVLEQSKKDFAQAETRLEEERKASSDSMLVSGLATAESEARIHLETLKTAEASFGNLDLETAKALLESAKSVCKQAREQHADQERELLQLRMKLDLLGENGLAESLAESQHITFETKEALDRLLKRAAAAKLLFETLESEREAMRQAYVAPLREQIERLGRNVYGESLCVEVDDSLQVVSRTIDGITVRVEQLSTGAREQLGLLVRLATAMIVAKNGGIPLVLDDALGATDETRLASMGAVIRIASRNTQTIILTCTPERYLHVGAEEMVRL